MRINDFEDSLDAEILHADRGHGDFGILLEKKQCVRLGRCWNSKTFDDSGGVFVVYFDVGDGSTVAVLKRGRKEA